MLIWLVAVFGICQWSESINMFGMECNVTQTFWVSPQNYTQDFLYTITGWSIYQTIDSGQQLIDINYTLYSKLHLLERRWYEDIKFLNTLRVWSKKFEIAKGKKCGKETLRVNGMDYTDDLGVIDIRELSWNLEITTNNNLGKWTVISCHPSTYGEKDALEIIEANKIIDQSPNLIITDIEKIPVYKLAEEKWYNWQKDREELARKAWITNYKWTKEQNLQIRDYLLGKEITPISLKPTETKVIYVSKEKKEELTNTHLWQVVKQRWYVWKYDRVNVATEFWYSPDIYRWTLVQNLKIRSRLLNKIVIK